MTPPLAEFRWIGELLHTSGITALGSDPLGGFDEQLRVVFARLLDILHRNGQTPSDVVAVSVYLSAMSDYEQLNVLYRQFFGGPPWPIRTTVECGLFPGVLVEVSAVAERNASAAARGSKS